MNLIFHFLLVFKWIHKCFRVGLSFFCGHHGNDGRFTYDAGTDSGFLSFFSDVCSAWGPCHPGATPGHLWSFPPLPAHICKSMCVWCVCPLLLLSGNAERNKTTVRSLNPENLEPKSSMGTVVSAESDHRGFSDVPAISWWTLNIKLQPVGKLSQIRYLLMTQFGNIIQISTCLRLKVSSKVETWWSVEVQICSEPNKI